MADSGRKKARDLAKREATFQNAEQNTEMSSQRKGRDVEKKDKRRNSSQERDRKKESGNSMGRQLVTAKGDRLALGPHETLINLILVSAPGPKGLVARRLHLCCSLSACSLVRTRLTLLPETAAAPAVNVVRCFLLSALAVREPLQLLLT